MKNKTLLHRCYIVLRGTIRAKGVLGIYLLFVWACFPVPANSDNSIIQPQTKDSFRIAFTRGIFSDVSETDGQAAVKAWSQAIAEEKGIAVQTYALIFSSVEDVNQAFRESELDGITILLPEYAHIDKTLICGPYFRSVSNESIFEQYVLLVRNDSTIKEMIDLRGHSIVLHDHFSSSMAAPWLDLTLYHEISETMIPFFGNIKYAKKLSSVVLDVFFRKQDSCLVTMNGFNIMAELNPQIRKQLRILIDSQPLMPTIFCFRKNMDTNIKDQIIDAILGAPETLGGKQVLQIFKASGMKEVSEEELKESLDVLAELDLLRKSKGIVIK